MGIITRFLGPMGLPTILTAAAAVFLIIRYEYRLLSSRDTGTLTDMRSGIDTIQFCAWLILFFSLVNPLFGMYSALTSIAAARTNDPSVMMNGLFNTLLPVYFAMLLLSALYLVWFLFRLQIDRRLKSIL